MNSKLYFTPTLLMNVVSTYTYSQQIHEYQDPSVNRRMLIDGFSSKVAQPC